LREVSQECVLQIVEYTERIRIMNIFQRASIVESVRFSTAC
jgi:hypothetical protein